MTDRVFKTASKPAHVKVKGNGMDIDIMIKIFKRKVKEAGILEEYKDRMEYIKPSKRKVERRNAAIRRQRKLDAEND
jgi:ribosomal protein S21